MKCEVCGKPATYKLVESPPFQVPSDKALTFCCDDHQKTVLMLRGAKNPDVRLVRLEAEQPE